MAQIAIDSAKRKFDVDVLSEIARIRTDLCVQEIGYPLFYADVQNKKLVGVNMRNKHKEPKSFKVEKINFDLKCPMNCVRDVNVRKDKESTIPFTSLLISQKFNDNDRRRKSRKVEKLIERYSLKVSALNAIEEEYQEEESWLLCQEEFEELIEDIREARLSHNYAGLMYWLICRSFITDNIKHSKLQTQLNKNRPILLRVLYEVNPKAFLSCFVKTE